MTEKKYGNMSKHLLEQKSKSQESEKQVQKVVQEPLHPSWEAKKRQKISINDFKGKKITFDDGEKPLVDNNQSSESMHPSWEAKRKLKKSQSIQLNSVKPQKIIFQDD